MRPAMKVLSPMIQAFPYKDALMVEALLEAGVLRLHQLGQHPEIQYGYGRYKIQPDDTAHAGESFTIKVTHLVDATGQAVSLAQSPNPVIQNLLQQGLFVWMNKGG